jgi:hypothetical protein
VEARTPWPSRVRKRTEEPDFTLRINNDIINFFQRGVKKNEEKDRQKMA